MEKETMKKIILALIVVMVLSACAPTAEGSSNAPAQTTLIVSAGENQHSFSAEDLQALPSTEATFNDVAYQGVTVSALLDAVSVDPGAVKAIKAVAADGYSVNYDSVQVLKDNVLVAYALADGSPLTADDGNFRMVLPDEEGKLNVRMLTELQIIQ
jgi:hypothetical protein